MINKATPTTTSGSNSTHSNDSLLSPLAGRVKHECDAMILYALEKGLKLPTDLFTLLEKVDDARQQASLSELVKLHNRLAEIISPATPGAIHMLYSDRAKHSFQRYLGPVPNIRYLMIASMIFILGFVGMSMTSYVNHQTLSRDIYDLVGYELLTIMLFLLCASGLGACFSALFSSYRFIAEGTYDPRYDSAYWSQIILGLIAGLVMSQLIPVQDWVNGSTGNEAVKSGSYSSFSKPLLALLGGFSASMVYKILQRLVETIESLFQGSVNQSVAQQEQTIRSKLENQFGEQRLSAASDLITLKEAIANQAPPERIAALATKALSNLTPGSDIIALPSEVQTKLTSSESDSNIVK